MSGMLGIITRPMPPQSQPALPDTWPLYVSGMHGRGDCIHFRAVLRQWIEKDYEVWLESRWVSLFWDFIETGRLNVIRKATPLRTQIKNARLESDAFCTRQAPRRTRRIGTWYRPEQIRRRGSVVAAMCETGRVDYAKADFRLPIHPEWQVNADRLIESWQPTKPLMILRPPCIRVEWGGSAARNPDLEAYAKIYNSISREFFVVSVADFELGKEWQAGPDLPADVVAHSGEYDSGTLAALFAKAKVVLTTGGFGVVLAQAVSTPVIAVLGGYEDHRSYLCGAKWTKYLGIDPMRPCQCFSHTHNCDKRIDLPAALTRIRDFLNAL